MKKIFKTICLAFIVMAAAGCSKEMYFSEDILVGDIMTSDQNKIENKIEMKTGGRRNINVQNANGAITATPKDEAIVTTSVYICSSRLPEITLKAHSAGKTEILIKDAKGKTAKLYVTVME